jgi:hypothetical protein
LEELSLVRSNKSSSFPDYLENHHQEQDMSLFGKHEYNHHYNMDEFRQEKSRISNNGGKGNAGEASFSGEHGMTPGASTFHG